MRLRYQPALDGLRAVAVLSVIAYHADSGWARGGFLGVDAFFVLSGFLITTLLVAEYAERRSIGLLAFWGRRARRLLPALFVVLLAVAVYGAVHIPAVELHQFRGDALASLAYVTNWRFIASGTSYFAAFATPSPVRHLWSLAIEEQFYLVWPLIVLACLRVTRGSLRALVLVSIGGIAASGFLMAAFERGGDVSRAYYGTDARAHSVLVGALLAIALASAKRSGEPLRRSIAVAGWFGFAAMAWMLHDMSGESTTYYRGGSLVFAVAVAALIAALVQPGASRLRSCFSLAPLVWVGRISYGLYLWHWPVDVFATQYRVGFGGVALQGVRLGITFACAIASYYLVEMPIRRGSISVRIVRPLAPVAIAATAGVIVLATAAAAPLPSYLGGGAQPVARRAAPVPARTVRSDGVVTKHGNGAQMTIEIYPCPGSTAPESSAASAAVQTSGSLPAPRAAGPFRVLVVGDSVACSVAVGLGPAGAPALSVRQAAVLGCGVVSGEVWDAEEPFPKSTGHCHSVVPVLERQAIADFRPDVVLWVSTWERLNLVHHGVVYRTGSEQWKRLLGRRLDVGYRRLTAGGAHLVVATIAAPAPAGQLLGKRVWSTKFDRRFVDLNEQLAAFAARHPSGVALLDVARRLCPDGPPCRAEVDGVNPRRIDGAHFDPAGAVWLSRWMLPRLLASAPGARQP